MKKNRILLFGALIGAFTGLIAALLLQRRAKETGTELTISAGEGMRLGALIIGLLRTIALLGDEKG